MFGGLKTNSVNGDRSATDLGRNMSKRIIPLLKYHPLKRIMMAASISISCMKRQHPHDMYAC